MALSPFWAVQTALFSGDFGVQLFFIVSGFVLALLFARHHLREAARVSLRAYFLRRVTRLEPPYFLAMIGVYLFLVVAHGQNPVKLLPHLLASLIYSHSLIFGQDSRINNVTWSLEVEIQFYILVPLLTLLFAMKGARARRAAISVSILGMSVIGPALAAQNVHLENSILRFAQYFLVGFLLADLMICEQLRPRRRHLGWDLVVACAVPLIVMLYTGTGLSSALPGSAELRSQQVLVLLPWLCFAAYLGVFRGLVFNALLTYRWITTIGGMCYSIYLLHNVILNNVLWTTKSLAPTASYSVNFAIQTVIMVPLILIVSAVFFVLVERPCMDKNWPTHARAWLSNKRARVS